MGFLTTTDSSSGVCLGGSGMVGLSAGDVLSVGGEKVSAGGGFGWRDAMRRAICCWSSASWASTPSGALSGAIEDEGTLGCLSLGLGEGGLRVRTFVELFRLMATRVERLERFCSGV